MVQRLSRTNYVKSAINDRASLDAFKKPPDARIISGVFAIVLSFIIAWPLMTVLAAAAVYYETPMVGVVGVPLAYGMSHLVFILGMYLSGAKYTRIFFRWATRVAMVKLLDRYTR